jgi:transketolase
MGAPEIVADYPVVPAPFGRALVEVAKRNTKVVGLTADLGKYTDILPFATFIAKCTQKSA